MKNKVIWKKWAVYFGAALLILLLSYFLVTNGYVWVVMLGSVILFIALVLWIYDKIRYKE